jgi:uncharacterized protein
MKQVLMDTGPLVAILTPAEHMHEICVSTLRTLPNPPVTCWPVVTEAMWLLREFPRSMKSLLSGINNGALEILSVEANEAGQIEAIMNQYSSLRPQFADVMLVHLARRENIETIFTLDRRDFMVYRRAGNKLFDLIPK